MDSLRVLNSGKKKADGKSQPIEDDMGRELTCQALEVLLSFPVLAPVHT